LTAKEKTADEASSTLGDRSRATNFIVWTGFQSDEMVAVPIIGEPQKFGPKRVVKALQEDLPWKVVYTRTNSSHFTVVTGLNCPVTIVIIRQ
jgi:hypothetical protein